MMGGCTDAVAEVLSITRLEGSRWRGGRLWSYKPGLGGHARAGRCAFISDAVSRGELSLTQSPGFGVTKVLDAFDRLNQLLTGLRASSYTEPYHWVNVPPPSEDE